MSDHPSAVAIVPWLALRHLDVAIYAIVVAVAFVVGIWSADRVIRVRRVEDPGVVVWDEFVGQWIALLPLVVAPRGWPWIVAGFALFRVFDVWKPWPASWADRSVKGGCGAMLDDAIAGGYAAVVLGFAMEFI